MDSLTPGDLLAWQAHFAVYPPSCVMLGHVVAATYRAGGVDASVVGKLLPFMEVDDG